MKIRKLFAISTLTLATLSSSPAMADLTTCGNLYVGRIWIERGYGLRAVVLLNAPTDANGSYWMYFDNWSADEKKSALATLTAAKLSGSTLNVSTDEVGSCGISLGGTQAKMIHLAGT